MKRTISWLLAAAMFISMFSAWSLMSFADEMKVSNIYGDVDASGEVDSADGTRLSRYLAKWTIELDMTAADVNGSGEVDSADGALLARYLAKWQIDSKIGQPIVTERTGSVTLNIGESIEVGQETEAKVEYEFSGTPVRVDVSYTTSDSTIADVEGNVLKAKKIGQVTVTVMATAVYADGTTFDALDTKTVTVVSNAEKLVVSENGEAKYKVVYQPGYGTSANWLSEASEYYTGVGLEVSEGAAPATGMTINVGGETFASALSVSLSELRDDGYMITSLDGAINVLAKTKSGIDKGVRYLMNACADKETKKVSVPSDMKVAEGVGQSIKNLTIAGNPITEYVIYCPEQTAEGLLHFAEVKNSASYLQKYIYWATGYRPEIVTEIQERQKHFFIKLDQTGELGTEGYSIQVADDIVTITGGVERGNLYGVFAFIEKYLGYRIFSTQEFIYEKENLDIPNGTETEFEPVFDYRCASWNAFSSDCSTAYKLARGHNSHDSSAYDLQNGSTGYSIGTTLYHAHSFHYQLGTPNDENPCLTKEENYEKCLKSICDLLDGRMATGQEIGKQLTQISVAINDNDKRCTCHSCRTLNNKENSPGGTMVHFVNRIAEQVENLYPGMEVFTIAYTYTKKAPVTSYRDSVVVCYCFDGACYRHPLQYDGCDTQPSITSDGKKINHNNTEATQMFEEWEDKASNRYVWYYSASFYWYVCPLPVLEKLQPDFRYIAERGTKGIYAEGSSREQEYCIYFEDLTAYLEAKLMWDPYMSEEEYEQILCEYLKVNYGSGWQAIREYIRMYHEAAYQAKCFITHFDWPKTMTYIPYYGEHYDEMRALFDEAIIKADTSEQVEKIEKLSTSMEFLALCAKHKAEYVNGTDEQKAAYEAHYREFWQYSRDNNIRYGDTGPYQFYAPATFDVTRNPMYWFEESWIPAKDLVNFEY